MGGSAYEIMAFVQDLTFKAPTTLKSDRENDQSEQEAASIMYCSTCFLTFETSNILHIQDYEASKISRGKVVISLQQALPFVGGLKHTFNTKILGAYIHGKNCTDVSEQIIETLKTYQTKFPLRTKIAHIEYGNQVCGR